MGHFDQTVNGPVTPAQVGADIASSRPIPVGVAWAGGGSHALALRGRNLVGAIEYRSVADPWYGNPEVSYSTFRNSYQGAGTWFATWKSTA